MITRDRLKELLHYDPETGVFTNLITRCGRAVAGNIAGSLNAGNGYVFINLDKTVYAAHRLAFLYMGEDMPPKHTDHINGVRNDNRWDNLRSVTAAVNFRNTKKSSQNKSGVNGVCWLKSHGKWQVQIRVNYKTIHIGHFLDFDEAVAARAQADIDHGFHANHGRD